jgi:hypothetical protein
MQQNPALTTLTIAGKMRYKHHEFQVLRMWVFFLYELIFLRKHDDLVSVSRSARRSFGLYCGGSSLWIRLFALIVLSEPEKKCQMDDVKEGILAIAHHDDLQLIEDMVCPSQNAGIYTLNKRAMRASRKP